MKFKVYFEIYGKKMMAKVDAKTAHQANEIVKDKIIFHKTEPIITGSEAELGEAIDILESILGVKQKT